MIPPVMGTVAVRTPSAAVTYRRIDDGKRPELLRLMAEIAAERDSHKGDILGLPLWEWQYRHLPRHESRVYGAFEDETLVGYYHVPLYDATVGGRACVLGVPQDVAVSARMRGRGVFRELAASATEQLGRDGADAAYTFPNANSIHTFLKYDGYTCVCALPSYAIPVDAGALLGKKLQMFGLERFVGRIVDAPVRAFAGWAGRRCSSMAVRGSASAKLVELFANHRRAQRAAVKRDDAFLRWRFEARPGSTYAFCSFEGEQRVEAAVVVKRDQLFGVEALLIMDMAHEEGADGALVDLVARIVRDGRDRLGWPFALVFAAGLGRAFELLPRAGFVPVPRRMNPRPLNLLVRDFHLGPAAPLADRKAWFVSLADWDVF
jgi:GNAT superfamily N-acetyltransferase